MNEFEKGAFSGFFAAVFGLAAWAFFTFHVGVVGTEYDWPFHLIQTDVWCTGDILVTLGWSFSALTVFGIRRGRHRV